MQKPFMQEVFERFHENNRPQEIRPEKTQQAIAYLKEFTGLTWENLAAKVGMIPSHLGALVRRNGNLKPDTARMMARVAHSYHLPVLQKWFEQEAMLIMRARKGRHAKAEQNWMGLDKNSGT